MGRDENSLRWSCKSSQNRTHGSFRSKVIFRNARSTRRNVIRVKREGKRRETNLLICEEWIYRRFTGREKNGEKREDRLRRILSLSDIPANTSLIRRKRCRLVKVHKFAWLRAWVDVTVFRAFGVPILFTNALSSLEIRFNFADGRSLRYVFGRTKAHYLFSVMHKTSWSTNGTKWNIYTRCHNYSRRNSL